LLIIPLVFTKFTNYTHTFIAPNTVDTLAERVDTLQSNINLLLEQAELDEQALQLSQEPAAQGEENSMQ
jgi:hypothetical protein